MSDHLLDSENDKLSGELNITGSSCSIVSSSLDATEEAVEQGARTPDYISDISDIPSLDILTLPTSQAREGAGRLEQILQIGPATRPDPAFIEEMNRVTQVQSAPMVDLIEGEDATSEKIASQASTFGCEGSES